MNSFDNKIVVIAGGTSGMGEQVAYQLAPLAKIIIILGRNKLKGERIAKKSGNRIKFMPLEMIDGEAVFQTLRTINETLGPIDYFFNFAGTFLAGEIRSTPIEDWHAIYMNNIDPIVNGTAAIYEIMRKNNHGYIINVASAAGLFPVPLMNIYGSTKSAVVSLTLGLRNEARAFNIKVSVVCPGIVETPLYDTAKYDGIDKRKALTLLKDRLRVQQPEKAAQKIIASVHRNKAIIHTTFATRIAWSLYRFSPILYSFFAQKALTYYQNNK